MSRRPHVAHTWCTQESRPREGVRGRTRFLLLVSVMSLHKITAGSGYDYLTRQVAVQDSTEKGHLGLASYYTQRGESPGVWLGSGMAGIDGLAAGDLVSVDFGAIVDGWHGDGAITFSVGEATPQRQRLSDVTRESLWAGIAAAHLGGRALSFAPMEKPAVRPRVPHFSSGPCAKRPGYDLANLDVSALGSMYANKIYMEGTDAGVGVHIDRADLTASDTLSINVEGVVENNGGRISGKNSVTVMGNDVLNHNGQITSEGMVSVAADNTLDNTNGVIKAAMVNVSGKNTVNSHGSIQGSQNTFITADSLDNRDGEILSNGDLTIGRASWNYNAQGVNNTHGRIVAKGALSVDAASLNNSAGRVETNGAMSVNVDTLTNDNGLISAGNGWNMISASMLNNDNGVIQSLGSDSQLQVSGNNMLSNRNGSIHSDGSVSINGALDNMSGTIAAEKDLFMYGTSYYSDLASKMEAGGNIDMTVTGTFQNAGTLKAGQDMMLTIGSNGWNNYGGPVQNSGSIAAGGRLALQMNSSQFDNSGDITANQMDLQLADLSNSGSIASNGMALLNTPCSARVAASAAHSSTGRVISSRQVTDGRPRHTPRAGCRRRLAPAAPRPPAHPRLRHPPTPPGLRPAAGNHHRAGRPGRAATAVRFPEWRSRRSAPGSRR